MQPFGLTGGIGCGKSTVAELLARHHDVLIFNSDQIAKQIMADIRHWPRMQTILGQSIINCGHIDFAEIARIIFADAKKKHDLEQLIHPLVWSHIQNMITWSPANKIPIVEAAILYEVGWEKNFAGIIVATCAPVEQCRRLRENRHMDEDAIAKRINQQMPLTEKETRADFIVHTDCTLTELEARVALLYNQLAEYIRLHP